MLMRARRCTITEVVSSPRLRLVHISVFLLWFVKMVPLLLLWHRELAYPWAAAAV